MKTTKLRILCLLSLSLPLGSACQRAGAEPTTEIVEPHAGTSELITGTPAQPNPGDETEVKDPFEPYGIGLPEQAIPREKLSPAEQAAADRSRNHDAATLEHYRSAVLQRSAAITGDVAARRLGVENLKSIGVVP